MKNTCTIEWLDSRKNIREEIFKTLPNPNLLQDPAYGIAMAAYKNQRLKCGIITINNQPAGYLQILENSALNNALHVIILDRGPLWFDGFGSVEHFAAFLESFRAQYPKRMGRKMRIIPETPPSTALDDIMRKHQFRKRKAIYQTRIIDLTVSWETLRANLKKSWRGTLKKAEKSNLTIEWDNQGTHLPTVLKAYALDKKTKGYKGASVELIQALSRIYIPQNDMLIGRVMIEGVMIAAVLILCHAQAATYQIGFTTQKGRALGAHNMVLWDAMKLLKNRGMTAFDLGGVNESDAKNVKAFKDAMGGAPFMCAGLYT